MLVTFKFQRGLAADWATINPILDEGEPGYEFDTGKLKIGDGVTHWNDLSYVVGSGSGTGGGPISWLDISGKPSTFPPSAHAHNPDDITGLDQRISNDVASLIQAGANIAIDTSVAGVLTISSTATGGGATDPEVVRDTMAAALVGDGSVISLYADDAADTITISAFAATPDDLQTAQQADKAYSDAGDQAVMNAILALLGKPAQVIGLNVSSVTASSVSLGWNPLDVTPTGYKVYRDGVLIATLTGGTLATVYVDTSRAPDTSFTYYVTAYNGSGDSVPSASVEAHTLGTNTSAPSAVTLSAGAQAATSISLSWSAATAPAGDPLQGYHIYRDGSSTPLANVGAGTTTYTDTGMAIGDTHSYTVAGYNNAGVATLSNSVTQITASNVQPIRGAFASAVQTANVAGPYTATLPASIVAGDVGFLLLGSNVTTVTPTTPPAGWTLVDSVIATGSNNKIGWLYSKPLAASDAGATVSATFSAGCRGGIVGVAIARSLQVPDVSVSWFDNSDDTLLEMPGLTTNSPDENLIALVLSRYNNLTGNGIASMPTGYTKQIEMISNYSTTPQMAFSASTKPRSGAAGTEAAANGTYAGTGGQDLGWLIGVKSNAANLPTSPTLVNTAKDASSIALSWSGATAPAGDPIQGYYVYRNGVQIAQVTSGTTYTDTGLTANTAYPYYVRGYNNGGTGAASATLSITTSVTSTARFPGDPGTGNLLVGSSDGGAFQGYSIDYFDKRVWGNPPTHKHILVRKYNNQNFAISSGLANDLKAFCNAGRIPVFSFKAGSYTNAQILNGTADGDIDANAAVYAALSGPIWVSFWHEPDNDARWTSAQGRKDYRNIWRYIVNRTYQTVGTRDKVAWLPILLGTNFNNDTTTWRNYHPNWNDAGNAWLTNGPFGGSYVHMNGFDRYDPAIPVKYPFAAGANNIPWSTLISDYVAAINANSSQARPFAILEFGTYVLPATLDDNGVTNTSIWNAMATDGINQAGGLVGFITWDNQAAAYDDQYDPNGAKTTMWKNFVNGHSNVKIL